MCGFSDHIKEILSQKGGLFPALARSLLLPLRESSVSQDLVFMFSLSWLYLDKLATLLIRHRHVFTTLINNLPEHCKTSDDPSYTWVSSRGGIGE